LARPAHAPPASGTSCQVRRQHRTSDPLVGASIGRHSGPAYWPSRWWTASGVRRSLLRVTVEVGRLRGEFGTVGTAGSHHCRLAERPLDGPTTPRPRCIQLWMMQVTSIWRAAARRPRPC